MIGKDDLQNRQERPMPGQAEADAAIERMKGRRPRAGTESEPAAPAEAKDGSADALATLRERIARARAVAPPSGDNQFAQGCFRRGRDAALAIIDGEAAS